MRQTLSLFSHLIHRSLIQTLFLFFLRIMVCLIHNLKYQILFQHLLQCLRKCFCFYVFWLCCCLYLSDIVSLFLRTLVSRNHTKTPTLLFELFLILIDLNRLFYSEKNRIFHSIGNKFSENYLAV